MSSAGSVEHVSSVLGGPLQSLFMELQPVDFTSSKNQLKCYFSTGCLLWYGRGCSTVS